MSKTIPEDALCVHCGRLIWEHAAVKGWPAPRSIGDPERVIYLCPKSVWEEKKA